MMASAVNVPIHRSPAVLPTFPTGRCGDASGLYRLLPTLTMRLNRLGIVGAKEKPMKKIDCFSYRLSTPIHKGHRFDKDDPLSIDPSFSIEGFETFSGNENLVYFGKPIHHLKPDIMSCSFIVDPRIPQSHDGLHTRLFFLLFLLLLHLFPFNCFRNYLFHDFLLFYHRGYDRGDGKVCIE